MPTVVTVLTVDEAGAAAPRSDRSQERHRPGAYDGPVPRPGATPATGRRLRGVLAGVVCALGAAAAHAAAGGTVDPGALLLAAGCSAGLGWWLLERTPDSLRTLALALLAQLVWHGAFMAAHDAPTSGHGHGHGEAAQVEPLLMLLTHLLAAGLSAGVAFGAERELVSLAGWLVGLVLPVLALAAITPAPATSAHSRRPTSWRLPVSAAFDPALPTRAPPSVVLAA